MLSAERGSRILLTLSRLVGASAGLVAAITPALKLRDERGHEEWLFDQGGTAFLKCFMYPVLN